MCALCAGRGNLRSRLGQRRLLPKGTAQEVTAGEFISTDRQRTHSDRWTVPLRWMISGCCRPMRLLRIIIFIVQPSVCSPVVCLSCRTSTAQAAPAEGRTDQEAAGRTAGRVHVAVQEQVGRTTGRLHVHVQEPPGRSAGRVHVNGRTDSLGLRLWGGGGSGFRLCDCSLLPDVSLSGAFKPDVVGLIRHVLVYRDCEVCLICSPVSVGFPCRHSDRTVCTSLTSLCVGTSLNRPHCVTEAPL